MSHPPSTIPRLTTSVPQPALADFVRVRVWRGFSCLQLAGRWRAGRARRSASRVAAVVG